MVSNATFRRLYYSMTIVPRVKRCLLMLTSIILITCLLQWRKTTDSTHITKYNKTILQDRLWKQVSESGDDRPNDFMALFIPNTASVVSINDGVHIDHSMASAEETDIPAPLAGPHVPNDLKSQVPDDSDLPVPNDPELLIPNDPESQVPNDPDILVPNDPESLVPHDPALPVPNDPESLVENDPESPVPNDPESPVPNEPESLVPNDPYSLVVPPNDPVTDEEDDTEPVPEKNAVPWPADSQNTDTKFVLLLSYQRTGSTFIGDTLFNWNPDVFSLYEPLDPLYATMYGVLDKWSVPSDITTHADGTLRIPPDEELQAVTWYLEQLYTCSIHSLPLRIYSHHFWRGWKKYMNYLSPFSRCLEKGLDDKRYICQNIIRTLCGWRFGQRNSNQTDCFKLLWEHRNQKTDISSMPFPPEQLDRIQKYYTCMEEFEPQVGACLGHFEKACQTKSIRAFKTVRATVDSVEPILKKYPNFYLIHLYRDPRPTVRSRNIVRWSLGSFELHNESATNISHVYCQTLLHDYKRRRELEEKYPGRIHTLVYDKFVADPLNSLRDVYRFLDIPLKDTFLKIFDEGVKKKNSRMIAQTWRRQMSHEDVRDIEKECGMMAQGMGFDWDV